MSLCHTSYMQTTITITSKGQVTLPAKVRKSLGLQKAGDKLILDYDERNHRAIISKPTSIEELSARLTAMIKPGIKPITNVHEYYEKGRIEELKRQGTI